MENSRKKIYILLTDTGSVPNRIIKWFTKAPYNHVSLVFDEFLEEIYSFARKRPKNPLIAGFVKEDVYNGMYRYFENTRCLLLKKDVTHDEYEAIRENVRHFINNRDSFSYNLIGLLGVLFGYPIGKKNAYFCSQFVAEVLEKSGIKLWDSPSGLVTPHHFLLHHAFERIYEGRLYDYPLLKRERILESAPPGLFGVFHAFLRKMMFHL